MRFQRIASVAGKLVPFMALAYLLAGLVILAMNIQAIPHAFSLIITHAFTPVAATGGFAGAAVWAAIRFGVARGIFSNEAGLGSAPIAHAAAGTDSPVQQGSIAMLGTFIDTIIICSITGLVIITTGAWTSGETGASLSPVLKTASVDMLQHRFERAEKKAHELPVKILLPLFVFIFPAIFLMILVPLYFQWQASGAGGAF